MRKIIVKVDKEKATELERVNFELNFVIHYSNAHPLNVTIHRYT